jgi:hypothetical protein
MFCTHSSTILIVQSLERNFRIKHDWAPLIFLIIVLILYEPVCECLSNILLREDITKKGLTA